MSRRAQKRFLWQQMRSAQAILLHAYENRADAESDAPADSLAAVINAQRKEIRRLRQELHTAYGLDVLWCEGEDD